MNKSATAVATERDLAFIGRPRLYPKIVRLGAGVLCG
jgi:hypothetical protein